MKNFYQMNLKKKKFTSFNYNKRDQKILKNKAKYFLDQIIKKFNIKIIER